MTKVNRRTVQFLLLFVALCVSALACSRNSGESGTSADKLIIQNSGSDTMVNLAQAWAEQYADIDSTISVEVSGGGSGTGIAALMNGTVDIANSSRKLKPEEIERAKQNTGSEPQEFVVGYDALAIYVHKDNPIDKITLEQLAGIYSEGGNITKWSELGVMNPACRNDEIIRISRQSNSGTYHYFREALLGEARDFKLGSRDLHGSKDVVELVASTPCAIGYSGLGYSTPEVKKLAVAKKQGDEYFKPSVETTLTGEYPIARPLYMYSHGTPNPKEQKYLDWIHSDAGQKIVLETGYVPLPKDERMSGESAQPSE